MAFGVPFFRVPKCNLIEFPLETGSHMYLKKCIIIQHFIAKPLSLHNGLANHANLSYKRINNPQNIAGGESTNKERHEQISK